MLDLKDNFFSVPFTANIRPSSRYGHACATNLTEVQSEDEKLRELIILGGLDH